MKIGITCYPTYGGSGAVATELGVALARLGHEVHFVTYKQPFRLPPFTPRVYFHEVDVGRYPLFEYPPYDLALAVRMHEVTLAHGLDLLHCHYAIPHATSAWIAKEMPKPTRPDIRVVTTLHGTDITIVGQDPSFRPITKFSLEKSDGLTAVSRYLQTETLTTFCCTACRIEVIPNFVDPEIYDRSRYTTSILEEQIAPGTCVLMHISNFRPVKRVRDVVNIFHRVQRKCPRCSSWSATTRPCPRRGRGFATRRSGQGVVPGEDRSRWRRSSPARRPLSLAVEQRVVQVERARALASGVPGIGTKVGGLPEVVRPGETGELCPVGDIEAMGAGGVAILRDKNRWQAMSKLAASDARERFSLDAIVGDYEAFYEYALAQRAN